MFRSIGLTIAATLLGQLLSFAVDILIAGSFGTSWAADAYFLALVIPVMLIELFTLAINAVFIPSYVTHRKTGNGDAFFSAILNASCIAAVLVAAGVYLLTPRLIDLVAGGFTPQARGLASTLTRILLVLVVTTPLASFMSNRLNVHHRFFLPALGRSFNFIFMIILLYALKDAVGIFSLPVGFLIGNVVFILALAVLFSREGLGYSFRLNARDAQLKETGVLLMPMLAAAAINYCGILVERSLAAGFPEGSIAALSYAFKLVNIPLNLFILGAMSVVLPAFSRLASDDDIAGLSAMLTKGLRLVSFFIIPAAAGMALLRMPLISLLFERGAFTAASSTLTSNALLYYVFGLFGAASVAVVSRVFLALKDIKTMSILGIVVVALNVVLLFALSSALGFVGIPLAFAITSTVHIAAMLVVLERRTGMDIIRPLVSPFARHLAAALLMSGALMLVMRPLGMALTLTVKAGQLEYVCIIAVAGTLLYLAFSFVLRVDETGFILERVNSAMRRFRA